MELQKDRAIILSDTGERDGIGVEIYICDQAMVEFFSDLTITNMRLILLLTLSLIVLSAFGQNKSSKVTVVF